MLGKSGFVDRTTHEEASVVSATGVIPLEFDDATERMHEVLEKLGKWVNDNGGIIGHIKCSLKDEHLVSMSMTFDEVQKKDIPCTKIPFTFASIAFGVAPEDLQREAFELLNPIVL